MPDWTRRDRGRIEYRKADEALIAALPELVPAHRRLVEDWDNFGGEPPGQFIVFADVLGPYLKALLHLPNETPGRDEALQRVIEFGERLMTDGGSTVPDLAIDAVAETLAMHREGASLVARYGGPKMHSWFAAYAPTEAPGLEEDFNDLWGSRHALADGLPGVRLTDLAGITSHDIATLPSLAAAQVVEDGVVLIGAFDFSHLYVVCHAAILGVSEAELRELAVALADLAGGEEPRGDPNAGYRRIILGERVWQLNRGGERHSPLTREPWVHEVFSDVEDPILEVIRGDRSELPSAPAGRAPEGTRW